mgnify:CR=1 FL=1
MADRHGNNTGTTRTAGIPLSGAAVLLSLFLSLFPAGPAGAQQRVEVRAYISEQEVYLGGGFIYQVQVVGGTRVGKVDLSGFQDFDVRQIPQSWLRYQDNEEWRKREKEGTSFYYRIFALKTGSLTIPPATVRVDGRTYSSPPIDIRVQPPPPSTEFRLELSLSRDRVYEGEPVELTSVWYFLSDARYYYVNIPILRHPAFTLAEGSNGRGSTRIYVRSAAGGNYLSGERGTAVVNGIEYQTATFKQVLIPKEAGEYAFLPGTVQVWWQIDENAPDPRGSRGVRDREFESTVIGSNQLGIRVIPLPVQGRPDTFSGIVAPGLDLAASASPTVMNVGDPVSLSLILSGPPTVKDADIPHLSDLPALTRDFTVRSGPMYITMEEEKKIFSQTIRVKREDVSEIPSLEVSYFNTTTGSYQAARSRPVPITVRPTRLVTASDLEGETLSGMSGTTVKNRAEGINFNYQGAARLLADQPPGLGALASRPLLLLLMAVPAALLLAALVQVRRDGGSGALSPEPAEEPGEVAPGGKPGKSRAPVSPPGAHTAAPSFRRLTARLNELRGSGTPETAGTETGASGAGGPGGGGAETDPGATGAALAAWREYLGARLQLSPGRLVFQDVEQELLRRGAGPELVKEVRELFGRYELFQYGRGAGRGSAETGAGRSRGVSGPFGSHPGGSLSERIDRAARMIERSIT